MSPLALANLEFFARDLSRPECVLATKAGNFYAADFRGGVCKIFADGGQQLILAKPTKDCPPLKPNGICMLENGDFLIAHLGNDVGGIYRLTPHGDVSPFLTHIDGVALPPSNFIYLDHQGRLWLTVSTRQQPRSKAYRSDVSDGFIAVIKDGQAKIVADNIGYTNEVYVSSCGKKLYVNATFTRETLSYDIDSNNELSNLTLVAKYGKGIFPDGLTMDAEGYLWITSIVSNTIVRVNPENQQQQIMLQDCDSEHLDWVEQAYKQHKMGRPHLDNVKSQQLQNISSLAFCGDDLSSAVLGCLLGEQLTRIELAISGKKPSHWYFDS